MSKPAVDYSYVRNTLGTTSYVPRQLMACVLKCPSYMPESLQAKFKHLFELHSHQISGLIVGYRIDSVVPGPFNATKGATFKLRETMDYAVAGTFYEALEYSETHELGIGPFDILFIEPDITHTVPLEAWLLRDVYFNGSLLERESQRDICADAFDQVYHEIYAPAQTLVYRKEALALARDQLAVMNAPTAD